MILSDTLKKSLAELEPFPLLLAPGTVRVEGSRSMASRTQAAGLSASSSWTLFLAAKQVLFRLYGDLCLKTRDLWLNCSPHVCLVGLESWAEEYSEGPRPGLMGCQRTLSTMWQYLLFPQPQVFQIILFSLVP